MPEISAITGRPSFWPAIAGGAAVPLLNSMTPLGEFGPWGTGILGAGAAAFGSGPIRSAGQGALIVVGAELLGSMLAGGLGGGGGNGGAQELV